MPTDAEFLYGTACWTAAARAKETSRSDRLFDDPYAASLAGVVGERALEASGLASGGENRYLSVRSHWFDQTVEAYANHVSQVVNLGAGLDTRPFRLTLPPSLRWFEIDLPSVFDRKEPALADLRTVPTCVRTVVPTDLRGCWTDPLLRAGLEADLPTLWLAEGLLFYLQAKTVEDVLSEARLLSGSGSLFVADLFGSALLGQRDWGQRTPYCSDDPVGLFERAGWPEAEVGEVCQNQVVPAMRRGLATAGNSAAHDPTNRAWLIVACA
jgi:methyltransferase (TIGR00027 family)